MIGVLEVPESFRGALSGLPGVDEPMHGDLVPPMLARPGDYVLDESDVWLRVTALPRPGVGGRTVVSTVGGPLEFPRGTHAWVWAARDLAAHLARGGEAA